MHDIFEGKEASVSTSNPKNAVNANESSQGLGSREASMLSRRRLNLKMQSRGNFGLKKAFGKNSGSGSGSG